MAIQRFPTALVTVADLPTSRADATVMATNHANDHDQIALELIALEAELGISPKGTYSSIKARLDAIQNQANAYVITNPAAADRAIDVNNTTLGELLNVVATLVADLQARKIIG